MHEKQTARWFWLPAARPAPLTLASITTTTTTIQPPSPFCPPTFLTARSWSSEVFFFLYFFYFHFSPSLTVDLPNHKHVTGSHDAALKTAIAAMCVADGVEGRLRHCFSKSNRSCCVTARREAICNVGNFWKEKTATTTAKKSDAETFFLWWAAQ